MWYKLLGMLNKAEALTLEFLRACLSVVYSIKNEICSQIYFMSYSFVVSHL